MTSQRSITQNGQQNCRCTQDARHTKDYRNVKCGDLHSVPTMKQSVCVCVQSNTVLQCSAAAAAAAQRSGSVLRRSGVTRDRLLPHSSAARRCREREKSQLFTLHISHMETGSLPTTTQCNGPLPFSALVKLLYQVSNTSIPQPLHCTHTLSLR